MKRLINALFIIFTAQTVVANSTTMDDVIIVKKDPLRLHEYQLIDSFMQPICVDGELFIVVSNNTGVGYRSSVSVTQVYETDKEGRVVTKPCTKSKD